MNERKVYPVKAEVLSVVFTPFGNYYSVFTPVTYEDNSVIIEHAVPRNSLENGLYSSSRRVVVNGSWAVEHLPKHLIIEVRPVPVQPE